MCWCNSSIWIQKHRSSSRVLLLLLLLLLLPPRLIPVRGAAVRHRRSDAIE
jgi:hypothetical protein